MTVERGGVELGADARGPADGPPVLLLHGLTATRRYVVMGSSLLERDGHRVVGYDARGHGESTAAPDPSAYAYPDLVADLGAVLDWAGVERAVLVGQSMGAHTAAAFALASPGRVATLVCITPGSLGTAPDAESLGRWEALADGFERGGVEGFIATYRETHQLGSHAQTVETVMRQRLALHRNPEGVVAALRVVPASIPFEGLAALGGIAAPTLVVASNDEADPGHPFAVAEQWSRSIPDARLVTEQEGRAPLAWQGGQLSKAIAGFLAEHGQSDRAQPRDGA